MNDLELGPFHDSSVGRPGEIQGVLVRTLEEHIDNRGRVFEFFSGESDFWDQPIAWGHCFTILPGVIKGWGVHLQRQDRYCLIDGKVMTVLFDSRKHSPSFGVIQEVVLEVGQNRQIRIPNGVWHLNVNLSSRESFLIDLPSHQYRHANPDKQTLSWDTDKIPYRLRDDLLGQPLG